MYNVHCTCNCTVHCTMYMLENNVHIYTQSLHDPYKYSAKKFVLTIHVKEIEG